MLEPKQDNQLSQATIPEKTQEAFFEPENISESENTGADNNKVSVLDTQIIAKLKQKPKLMMRVSQIYLDTTVIQLEQLQEAVVKQNLEQVEAIAHPFKSSSRILGAITLGKKLDIIEAQAREGQLSKDIHSLMQAVHEEYLEVIEEIKSLSEK